MASCWASPSPIISRIFVSFSKDLTHTDLFSSEIYFLSQLPAKIDYMEVALVVTIAFTLSFLATIYPAWRAAQLDPVEALRYE